MTTRPRPAIRRVYEIIAECPIGCICSTRIKKTEVWQNCGHYHGNVRFRRIGLRVLCSFTGR